MYREGEAALTVLALGKTFQRAVTRPITITQPWYRVSRPPWAGGKVTVTVFQPDPVQRPENLAGCLTLESSREVWQAFSSRRSRGLKLFCRNLRGVRETAW